MSIFNKQIFKKFDLNIINSPSKLFEINLNICTLGQILTLDSKTVNFNLYREYLKLESIICEDNPEINLKFIRKLINLFFEIIGSEKCGFYSISNIYKKLNKKLKTDFDKYYIQRIRGADYINTSLENLDLSENIYMHKDHIDLVLEIENNILLVIIHIYILLRRDTKEKKFFILINLHNKKIFDTIMNTAS